jgi:arylsulfatase A-like enzyme
MAYRMQASVPEVMDISQEPAAIHELYGTQPGKESFANNCLLARRLAESGVRFIQLYDWGWDSHGADKNEALNAGFQKKCQSIDRPISGLLTDLKQRGLLDDTLVVFSGEFGRTPMQENRGGAKMAFIGRDHNPHAFSLWMAGGGVKPGFSYGESDEFGYRALPGQEVHVRDFHATLLHLLGFDHRELNLPLNGLQQKLTGVKQARVIKDIIA